VIEVAATFAHAISGIAFTATLHDEDGNDVPDECEQLVGDLDGSGTIDEQDRAILCSALGAAQGEPAYLSAADFNDDGIIDHLDLQFFSDILPACAGDIVSSTFHPPADGVTNGFDLAFLLGAWNGGASCADFVGSDFLPPPDGNVDGFDLAVLLGAWGACP
jgi:hypothetical protein